MYAVVRCKFQGCGFCSKSGFCLNRVTVINEYGMCQYITKTGWNDPIKEDWKKNTYIPPREDLEEPEEQVLAIEQKQQKQKKGPTVDDFLSGRSTEY